MTSRSRSGDYTPLTPGAGAGGVPHATFIVVDDKDADRVGDSGGGGLGPEGGERKNSANSQKSGNYQKTLAERRRDSHINNTSTQPNPQQLQGERIGRNSGNGGGGSAAMTTIDSSVLQGEAGPSGFVSEEHIRYNGEIVLASNNNNNNNSATATATSTTNTTRNTTDASGTDEKDAASLAEGRGRGGAQGAPNNPQQQQQQQKVRRRSLRHMCDGKENSDEEEAASNNNNGASGGNNGAYPKQQERQDASNFRPRVINILHPEAQDERVAHDPTRQEAPYADNFIKTSKYSANPASRDFFLWKNLYEQFQRKANVYFLIIGGLQLIPGLSPTGQFTTLSTLLAVLVFSMLKSGYEDFLRHTKDNEVNAKTAYVLRLVPREVPPTSPTAIHNSTSGGAGGSHLTSHHGNSKIHPSSSTTPSALSDNTTTAHNQKKNKKKESLRPAPPSTDPLTSSSNPPPPPVLLSARFVPVRYSDIRVGDIVRVFNTDVKESNSTNHSNDTAAAAASSSTAKSGRNNALPCDLMLLASADPEGVAYLETSNLDGETNLKMRRCLEHASLHRPFGGGGNNNNNIANNGFLANSMTFAMDPFAAHAGLLDTSTNGGGHQADINFLGGSAALTQSVELANGALGGGHGGDDSPHQRAGLLAAASHAAGPGGGNSFWAGGGDGGGNQLFLSAESGTYAPSTPNANAGGNITGGATPSSQYHQGGRLSFGAGGASGPKAASYRSGGGKQTTAQLCAQQFEGSTIVCEPPNGSLYTFTGSITLPANGGGAAAGGGALEKIPITPDQMLYRGSVLRKVPWVVGVCVFTGRETKVMMNARKPPHKSSQVEALVNVLLLTILALQAVMVVSAAIVTTLSPSDMWYLKSDGSTSKALTFIFGFITFLILFNNLIPISLYVTLELIKFFQGRFMEWDLCLYYPKKDMPASAKTTDLNEELGQINYIFSDKTGTLTCNVMNFMKFYCHGSVYGAGITEIGRAAAKRRGIDLLETRPPSVLESDFPFYDERITDGRWWQHDDAEHLRRLFTLLAVCHTVVVDQGRYEAESPDEEALVKAAAHLGIRFANRRSDHVILEIGSARLEERVEVIDVIPFDSDRKRMSVLVRYAKSNIYRVLTKGADNVMMPLLDTTSSTGRDEDPTKPAVDALEQFSNEGLRVLVLADRTIPESVALQWSYRHRDAKEIIGNDERKQSLLQSLAAELECNLSLVGVTGIEDRLQDDVPAAMERFRQAGIKIWMLTGDKVETAINIGFACSLLYTDSHISTFVGVSDKPELLRLMASEKTRNQITSSSTPVNADEVVSHSLVIDGESLHAILEDDALRTSFYDFAAGCISVICCRVSPKQKALVVSLMREKDPKAVTLAIGDGANDVPMIQSAHVGVGISGMEGQQAANAADYAIGQFRYLQRLLLVHGRANYSRLATTINYFFYKNALIVMTQFWFCIFNRFTGQSLYEKWTLSGYNVAFTALPIIAFGVLDRDILNTDHALTMPQLYQAGIKSELLNVRRFTGWLLTAVLHSIGIFFIIAFGWGGDGISRRGFTGGLDSVGLVMMLSVIIVANIKLALHTNSFAWVQHILLWGSIVFFLIYCAVFGVFPVTFSTTMYNVVNNVLSFFSAWLFVILTCAMVLLPDFFGIYAAYRFFPPTILRLIQLSDARDPMASIRAPAELRARKSPISLLLQEDDQLPLRAAAPPTREELENSAIIRVGGGGAQGGDSLPLSPASPSSPTTAAASAGLAAMATKNQIFQAGGGGSGGGSGSSPDGGSGEDELETTQGILLDFMDVDLEDLFLIRHVGHRLSRYKVALGLGAVASTILFIASAASYKTAGIVEPVMWGVFCLSTWVTLAILFFSRISITGKLHAMLLTLMVVAFLSLSIANLLGSRRQPETHPVTLGVILLGLLTVLRPPFIHGLQYALIAILCYIASGFILRPTQWSNADLILRIVEVFIILVTAMIALYMSESFSRLMFISQLKVRVANRASQREEKRSLLLLGNVLPSAIVQEVRKNKRQLGQFSVFYDAASTLHSDIVKFTNFSSTKEPHVVVDMLNTMFTKFDSLAKELRIEKIKTIGDAYVCASGIPAPDSRHQEKIILMGLRMVDAVDGMNATGITLLKELDIKIRIGAASGHVGAGVVGMQKVCYEVFGYCAELSEKMEQSGLPNRVHLHPSLVNDDMKHYFSIEEINGEFFVEGLQSAANIMALEHSLVSESPADMPLSELSRQDIYSFLEDEDEDRRVTLRLWANFKGEMKTGLLHFTNEFAEMEFDYYIRVLAQNRFLSEGWQAAYIFTMATLLLALFIRSVHAMTFVALVIALMHVVLAIAYGIRKLRRRRMRDEKRRLEQGLAAANQEPGSPLSPLQGGADEEAASAQSSGAQVHVDSEDEADISVNVSKNFVHSRRRTRLRSVVQPSTISPFAQKAQPGSGGATTASTGSPHSGNTAGYGLSPPPRSSGITPSAGAETLTPGGTNGEEEGESSLQPVTEPGRAGATGTGPLYATAEQGEMSLQSTTKHDDAIGAFIGVQTEYGDGADISADPANIYKEDALPMCTGVRMFAFASGLAALVVPIIVFFTVRDAAVINVFIVLSAQCYVMTMLHTQVVLKLVVSIVHWLVVSGSFAYAILRNAEESVSVIRDGGNYFALCMCYLLTFLAAFITEKNVRQSFSAAKNVMYQNAETQSAVALCDKILNNVLPKAIVKRMKEFPDKQIVDEVSDASVLFVYTDGLEPDSHAVVAPAAGGTNSNNFSGSNTNTPRGTSTMKQVVQRMNAFLWMLDAITVKYHVEKIKTSPFLVVSGCPDKNTDHPQRLAEVATAILGAVEDFNEQSGTAFRIKIGIHTGKVTAGVLGSTKFLYDVFGDTVNFASRLTSSAQWGTIQLSADTAARLHGHPHFAVQSIGEVELKGKGKQEVFLLERTSGVTAAVRAATMAAAAMATPMARALSNGGEESVNGAARTASNRIDPVESFSRSSLVSNTNSVSNTTFNSHNLPPSTTTTGLHLQTTQHQLLSSQTTPRDTTSLHNTNTFLPGAI